MKSVLVLALFAILAVAHADQAAELRQQFDTLSTKCAQLTGLSEDGLARFRVLNKDWVQNVECFHKCLFEQGGIVQNRQINTAPIVAFGSLFNRDPAELHATNERCAPLYNPDTFDCNQAWELFKCFN